MTSKKGTVPILTAVLSYWSLFSCSPHTCTQLAAEQTPEEVLMNLIRGQCGSNGPGASVVHVTTIAIEQ